MTTPATVDQILEGCQERVPWKGVGSRPLHTVMRSSKEKGGGNKPLSSPCLGGGVPVAAACGACDPGFTLEMVTVVSQAQGWILSRGLIR